MISFPHGGSKMNSVIQSIRDWRWLPGMLPLFVLLWLVYVFWCLYPGHPTGDSMAQLLQVQQGCVNNWKPALYAYLLGFSDWLFPGAAVPCAFVLQVLLFALGFFLLFFYLGRKNSLFYLLSPLVFCMGEKGISVVEVGNDAVAAGCYMVFIAAFLHLRELRNRRCKIVLFAISLAVLGFGMIMRHNAVFAVLVLLCWAFFSLTRSWKKSLLAAVVSVFVFFAVNAVILDGIAKVEKSYPLKSPFADDLVNISLLENRWDDFCVLKQMKQGVLLPAPAGVCRLCADVCNFYPSGLDPYSRIADDVKRREDYAEYQDAWLRAVRRSPEKYVFLKAYFFHQFLLAGRSLPWVEDYVLSCYPHVTTTASLYCRGWSSFCNSLFLFNALLPLAVYLMVCGLLVRRVVTKVPFSPAMLDTVLVSLSVSFYTGTFVIFTLSTTEERYYVVPALMSFVSLLLFVLAYVSRKSKSTNPEV